MATKVAVIHTAASVMKIVADALEEAIPGVQVVNILDDSIVPDAVKAGDITDNLQKRMLTHFEAAEMTGADLVLLACSTVGETADSARPFMSKPVLRIDEA
ncbi:MAG: hypothetical protein M0Z94_11940, partial [Dehalococcoidales bacterium]|nr:hypothetical protein [Dehalococcoidales bacterium]